jgi:hypothetical protein
MSVPARRSVAIAVALLILFGAAILGLRATGSSIAQGPLLVGEPGASPNIPGSARTGIPTSSASPDANATFTAIEHQVESLRALPPAPVGAPELITTSALAERLRARFDTDYPAKRRADDNVVLRALGLLGADQDAASLQLQLLTGQVIGYYDDTSKRMVVVSDAGVTPVAKVTYAHEYTHALQDASFGLARLGIDSAGQDDRDLARLSLVEGDATATMFLWAFDNMTTEELIRIGGIATPNLPGIPAWMVKELELPYVAGASFVTGLRTTGGNGAIDAAFRDPPASTEQILHPEKYDAHEAPLAIRAPAMATLGSWSAPVPNTEGEAIISIWLQALGVSASVADQAAAGWGGDRLAAASGPSGAFLLAWHLTWDTTADADQFAAAYATARTRLAFKSRLVRLSSRDVLVVHASSQALLDKEIAGAR